MTWLGYMTEESLKTIQTYLGAGNVDSKSFSDKFYKDVCRPKLGYIVKWILAKRYRFE